MKNSSLFLKIDDENGFVAKHVFYSSELDRLVPHHHNAYEMLMILSDECIISSNDKTQIFHKYDIQICAPNQVHTMAKRFPNHEHYFVNFTSDYIDPDIQYDVQKLCSVGKYTPRQEDIPLIIEEFENLCGNYEKDEKYKKKWLKTSIERIIITMLSNPSGMKNENNKNQTGTSIDSIVEYLNKNFANNLDLESVAEVCHMAPTYFSRVFKKNVGMGFKDYLIMVRINEAKRLLVMTKDSVATISVDSGFNDSNYFSSVFKSRVGCSPLQFRNKYSQTI